MEESTNNQVSQPGHDNQVPPTKEPGDDNEMKPLNPTGKSLLKDEIFITVARMSLNIKFARLWVKLFKRIREPMILSLRIIQKYSLTESKTPPLTVLTSKVQLDSDDDKTLAAKQRVQSCHLFIQQTLRNDGLRIPRTPPDIFSDLTDTKKPYWQRLFPEIADLDMITVRNHFAHNFGIPVENRPSPCLPDPWDDFRIFEWVQKRYTYLEPVITTLLGKLEAAILDEDYWKNGYDDHLLYTDEPTYRRDEEDAEPIWIKYLKEEEEKRNRNLKEWEELQLHGENQFVAEAEKSQEEVIRASGMVTDLTGERQLKLDHVIYEIGTQVKEVVGADIEDAVRKVLKRTIEEFKVKPATEATADTIMQAAASTIIKTATDTLVETAMRIVPLFVTSAIEEATEGKVRPETAVETSETFEDDDKYSQTVQGDWDREDPPDPGFDKKPSP